MWIFLILALNFAISWWNAYACGKAWEESKAMGGVTRFLVWCGVIQSAIGFSSVFLFPLAFIAHAVVPGIYTEEYLKGTINLWYLTIIIPALGTGLAITVESWMAAYRERDLLSISSAAYNTFAMAHNISGAVESIGPALSQVGGLFGNLFSGALDDNDDPKATLALGALILMLCIVILAIGLGALLTAVLVKKYSGTVALPARAVPTGRGRHIRA